MSRSRKKNAFVKDSGSYKKHMQKLSHSRVRKQVRMILLKRDFDKVLPLNRELTNQWDVCDWSWHYSEDELKKKDWAKTIKIKGKVYLRK